MISFSIVAYGQSLRVHRIRWWASWSKNSKHLGLKVQHFPIKSPGFPKCSSSLHTTFYIGEKMFVHKTPIPNVQHSTASCLRCCIYVNKPDWACFHPSQHKTRRRNCFTLKTLHLFPFELRMFSMPKCQLHHTLSGVPKPQTRVQWKEPAFKMNEAICLKDLRCSQN